MLNQERLNCVLNRLNEIGAEEMLVTEPRAIFWLTGKWVFPGERFLALLIRKNEQPVLFINRLFWFDEEIGVRKVWFSDADDVLPLVRKELDPEKVLGVDKTMESRFLLPLLETGAAKKVVNSSIAVDEARAVKDLEEQAKMRESSRINDLAMEAFRKLVHEGVTELEISDQTLKIYKSLGASGYSFDPIVSFGANAADPHHMPDETVLKEGDCVLFDIGCVVNDYCSDMTRTFYWKKEPDERVKRIYELVRQANEQAEEMLKPGIPLCDVDAKARDLITAGGYGPQFNHRLGHFIGLADHEYGDVSSANHNLTKTGNFFSIEPGIYLAGDTGVRIEDLVLITENGHEVLNHYPKELTILD